MNLSSFSVKVLAASLLLASTAGLAFAKDYKGEANYKGEAPCPAPIMLMDGFYLGGQVGYDSYRVRENYDIPALGVTANPVINATGWVGGLFLGYGRYLTDLFYLGGEIYGNGSGAEESHTVTVVGLGSYTSKIEARSNYGIALIPGIRLNNTSLGYLRLGYNWANFKARETAPGASISRSKTLGGFDYGVGIETLVYPDWSVRTEYTHTSFNSFTTSFGTRYKPADNQFMVGVVYHFA